MYTNIQQLLIQTANKAWSEKTSESMPCDRIRAQCFQFVTYEKFVYSKDNLLKLKNLSAFNDYKCMKYIEENIIDGISTNNCFVHTLNVNIFAKKKKKGIA